MATKKKAVTSLDSSYMNQYDAHMERQRRKKQRLIRRLVLFSIVVVVTFGGLATYHFNQRALQEEKQEEYAHTKEKLAKMEKKENSLEEEIKLLNNKEYVLEIARTNYFFSKEGELIFNVPDEDLSY